MIPLKAKEKSSLPETVTPLHLPGLVQDPDYKLNLQSLKSLGPILPVGNSISFASI
jgi:hypothetical protein